MLDVQAVFRPWSSHAWRVALASTAVALPLHVLPAGAGAASPGQPLQQPLQSDNAAYVADVTIPDGTVLAPGQRFTKTWQIQNTGTSTWDGRYHWQFEAGAPLGTVRAVTAPIVPPSATALFSVEMMAPQQPGSYRGFWQMTDPSGAVFGHQAWVLVYVEAGSRATLTPLPTATAQPTAMLQPAQQVMTATVTPSSPVVTATVTPSSTVVSTTLTPSAPV